MADEEALSVSAAMALAKGALEAVTVRIMGEVSEVSAKPGYKAVYFTVKDQKASLPCMMWNNRYQASGVQLRVGMLVEIAGRFSLYAPKGRMNFDVFSLAVAGEGVLRMQVAELARRLQAEGLTSDERKRPLPPLPETLGLVTSPRGAAVHDVLRTLRRRYPLGRILLAGVPVEGPRAPEGLIAALECVVSAGAEVVLLVRGGGSFEDLMPFNDEALARAIAACPVPVVTGIGHEPDTSIADMVADRRASTPTAAAEVAAPSQQVLAESLRSAALTMESGQKRRFQSTRMKLDRIGLMPLFSEPGRLLETEALQLDDLRDRLPHALKDAARRDRASLDGFRTRLILGLPSLHIPYRRAVDDRRERLSAGPAEAARRDRAALENYRRRLAVALAAVAAPPAHRLDALRKRMVYQGEAMPERFRRQMGAAAASLEALSPLSLLSRGYALTRNGQGSVITSVDEVTVGETVSVSLKDGDLKCTVADVKHVDTTVVPWKENR